MEYKIFSTEQIDFLEEAKMFAVRNHGLQEYDGFPYHKHLMDVQKCVMKYTTDFDIIVAAWLHDVIEDSPVSICKRL
jgi:guanosine-3',5'-bis(diphosphate) 3'-pyrophosphohydrolase